MNHKKHRQHRISAPNLTLPCEHVTPEMTEVRVSKPALGCVDCLATGTEWVHLRKCLACGVVRCCDSSPMKHATAHFHATGHPIVATAEPTEDWAWCYVDERYMQQVPEMPGAA